MSDTLKKETQKESVKPALPEKMKYLDESTRKKYFSSLSFSESDYDPSVFIEALRDDKGNLQLYVPARKRMAWFKTDYPEGMVMLDPPQYCGRRVTVTARVYKTREDYKNNLPSAVNMATRVLADNDDYLVDVCVTRAQSRALRDMGYDIPRDAHIIEGWTPIKDVSKHTTEEALDAMESSIVIENYMSDLEPTVPTTTPAAKGTQPASAAPVSTPAPQPAQTVAPVAQANPDTAVESAKMDTPALGSGEQTKATEEKESTVTAESQSEPQPEVASKPAETEVAGKEVDILLQRAESVFPAIDAAEAYTSRLLSGKPVGEQTEMRIKYYARKAMNGTCRDEKLGLAMYMVAKNRSIEL